MSKFFGSNHTARLQAYDNFRIETANDYSLRNPAIGRAKFKKRDLQFGGGHNHAVEFHFSPQKIIRKKISAAPAKQ